MSHFSKIFLVDDFFYIGVITDEDDEYLVLKKYDGEIIRISKKLIVKVEKYV